MKKLKRMLREEDAMGCVTEICVGLCTCEAWSIFIDTLICGGQGMLRGAAVPIINECIKQCAGLLGA
ncbi:hypothetical protein [Candidatus Methanoliparum sp. LAM-1]|uniref:hypothetical protein n=1 Tax=Candidatus Methanoliparum sp. LAM-1 TaxID=2874846 RepID=UPI001E4C6921|nr:hypothetical protein [Candidatus Methanoliparum sp. LAM-1]